MKKHEGKQQETCLVIVTGLLVIWYFTKNDWLLLAAGTVGFVGAFVPLLAKWVNWAWYKLAEVMGWVMSKVLLTAIFYGFLSPIAFLARLFGKSSLQLKRRDDTYWTVRDHEYSKKDLEQVW